MSTLYLQKTQKEKQKTKSNNKQQKKHCQTKGANIIVHFDNGTCRKLMPYHQDPDLFLRNYSTIKNIFIYFIKECFGNMKFHFPCPTILILLFFEIVFEIQFPFLHY